MLPKSSSPSVYSVSDSDSSDYAPSVSETKRSSFKRKRAAPVSTKSRAKTTIVKGARGKSIAIDNLEDIENLGSTISRRHGMEYHSVGKIVDGKESLLSWFERVREKRGMPWRKKYDPSLSVEEKGQRAYEVSIYILVHQEVIAYWRKWMERWPTIGDLAKADVEVRGLGYYRRARSLLAGAKTVMGNSKYEGRLPDDPVILEKEIDGVGRYTAGVLLIDGNIHRLLTRLLAVHAPQTAPATIKFLWWIADELINHLPSGDKHKGVAGDWNQALMELGSQICKPANPECGICPLRKFCKGYAELSNPPPLPSTAESDCKLCAPIPCDIETDKIPTVMMFPMKKGKKASRVEEESVCVVQWRGNGDQRRWLFIKRPEKGLLAGLFEPPTTPVSAGLSPSERLSASLEALSDYIKITEEDAEGLQTSNRDVGNIPHIFSHINMTYHIHLLTLTSSGSEPPSIKPRTPRPAVWLSGEEVEKANVGTGVKKVWAEIYGSWGSFEESKMGAVVAKKEKITNNKSMRLKSPAANKDGKIVKKVMMPAMPTRKKVVDVVE
ncbi:A/G-specific adenine glycosylase [Cryptococcus gattii E566]|uniref:Adenine DNA glycosylase n=2 Tax=Cryptococcus gattii TaxID=37769 RepID=E6QZV8_CRYGW|nr:A/G-specific adenine DNA glycosylase, putative [Cryptococcus gattii WM276]ADV20087.1 A/G-specific adenine DNA glycosylase, putative [Cryptococcus gattii WM276]KIR77420.1 A/G-specific adenine glycosylase [Cryptococcus gattii EJB2]KIY36414.1 A/G-specific adenine glycosylase [Cryptococcus gattii E566]KJE05935.1 A/G-specific adenine glycosylase [Cryptococcus gattii NT-10]